MDLDDFRVGLSSALGYLVRGFDTALSASKAADLKPQSPSTDTSTPQCAESVNIGSGNIQNDRACWDDCILTEECKAVSGLGLVLEG